MSLPATTPAVAAAAAAVVPPATATTTTTTKEEEEDVRTTAYIFLFSKIHVTCGLSCPWWRS